MTSIITIHSFRRGTGKSLVAANLAGLLAADGRRIGVVDADLQSPGLLTLFGRDHLPMCRTLNDYLWHRCDIEQTIQNVTPLGDISGPGRIFLIPASSDPHQIALLLRTGYDLKRLNDGFQTIIEELKLDALIVDTHAGLHEESLPLMAICDTLAIMLRSDQQDFHGTGVLLGVARQLRVPRMMLIGNEVSESLDAGQVKHQFEQVFSCQVAAILPHSEELMALASADIFVLRYPHHPITNALRHIKSMIADNVVDNGIVTVEAERDEHTFT